MAEKIKKLTFIEIGNGKLLSEVQSLFEQAQIEAMEGNADITVGLKIVVSAPDKSEPDFGRIMFTTDMNVPPKKSMQYTTELKNGVIVNSGESQVDLLLLSLNHQIPGNVVPMDDQAAL